MPQNNIEAGITPPATDPDVPNPARRGFLRRMAATIAAIALGATYKPDIAVAQTPADALIPPKTPEGPPAAYAPFPKIEITAVSEMKPEDVEKSKETVVNTLNKMGVMGAVREIWLTPESKVTADDTDYGKIINERRDSGRGHGGIVRIHPDGRFIVVIGIGADQSRVEDNTHHEGVHTIDPKYPSIIYKPEMLRQEALQMYDKFGKWYKEEILAQGKYVDEYDQDVLGGCHIEVGEKTWSLFTKALGIPETDIPSVPSSELETALQKPDLPTPIRNIIENFNAIVAAEKENDPLGVKATIRSYFNVTDLGTCITSLYFQGRDGLSAFPQGIQEELEGRMQFLADAAKGEVWAKLGEYSFKNPGVVNVLYPVFRESFDPIYQNAYQKLNGRRWEGIPQSAPVDGTKRASNLWGLISPHGKELVKNYLQTEGEDGASQKLSKALLNFYLSERREIAELVFLHRQDPKNLEFAKAA